MPLRPQRLLWWHSDSGVLPSAAPVPWTEVGTGTPSLVADGVQMIDAGGDVYWYEIPAWATDTASSAPRARDVLEFQIRVRGVSQAPSGATSPIFFGIGDGRRVCWVSIGSTLKLMDTSGVALSTVRETWPWTRGIVYLLRKDGTAGWKLWADGELLCTLPYEAAGADSGAAKFTFGSNDVAGTATTVFDQVECGLNHAVPPQWKVSRQTNAMPSPVRNRWTEVARAAMRATVGIVEGALQSLGSTWPALTAETIDEESLILSGLREPIDEGWTEHPALTLVRQRVRCDSTNVYKAGVDVSMPAAAPADLSRATYRVRATWWLHSYTADADGHVGPYLEVIDGSHRICAALVEVPGAMVGTAFAWVLNNGIGGGYAIAAGAKHWRVDPYQEHEVELVVCGQDHVLLLVDRHIVDRLPYTAFPGMVAGPTLDISCYGTDYPGVGLGPTCVADVWAGTAARRWSDLGRRPLFLQNAVERLIHVGGCERNDELEAWMERHHEVQDLRGTTQGILVETRRLACDDDAEVVENERYLGWVLGMSFPHITPIFLGLTGNGWDVYVEFRRDAPNFTVQSLANLIARYLLPRSTLELRYFACLVSTMTAASAVVGGMTRVTVADTDGFTAGDAVTLRNAANTTQEDTVVDAVVSATEIDLTPTFGTWIAGDIVRKVLAES